MLDLKRQFASIREEVLREVEAVFESQRFILGEQGVALEREIAEKLSAGHAIALSSGTDALLAGLMALGIKAGDEVVVPSFSFFATAGVVSRLSAVPVFADIDERDFTLSPGSFEAKVTPRTRAVIPVHLYGQSADLDSIREIAARRKIAVLEDACQAIGATYKGRAVGTIGEIGAFSFFPTKNLGSAGDAGLATTNDDALAGRLRKLRVHGMEARYYHAEVGGNFRMDEIQAAVLRVKLRKLDEWTGRRREIAAQYARGLAGEEAAGRIVLPKIQPGRDHIFHQFVVRVRNRDEVRRRLSEAGVGSEVYYPVSLHLQECFAPLGGKPGDLPVSEKAAREVLALPIWPELTDPEVFHVVSRLTAAIA
jgi:dTDP-4-amino-4,6-dideoxygalactose transaminase